MTSAEIKAKQLALEEQRRMEEFEKQLEVKRELELARDEAERLKFKAKERRKTQQAKDEAARLAAEAAIFEKTQNEDHDPEALPNRLLDFADESLEFEHANAVQGSLNLFLVFIPMKQKRITKLYCQPTSPQKLSNPQHHCNSQNQLCHSKFLRVQGLTNLKKHCHLVTHGLENYKQIHQL